MFLEKEIVMAKYGNLSNWSEFHQNVSSKIDNLKISMTDFFDYLLLQGGGIKDVHRQIMNEQEKRRKDQALTSKKRYENIGYLYESNGEPQDKTLFGHIASRLDLSCNIEFKGLKLDSSVNKVRLHEEYEKNTFIRIEGFKGDRRKDRPAENKGDKVFSSNKFLPTKIDVDNALERVIPPGNDINIELVLDQIEKDFHKQGRKLKSNWRMITERNIPLWFGR